CPAAEPLMAYLAQCAPERIPMTLVEGAVEDETQRLQALAALAEVSLVKHDPFEDGTPATRGSVQEAGERLIARLAKIYPEVGSDNPQSWPVCACLTPHLLTLGSNPDDASVISDWPSLLNRASGYFYGRGAYVQAEPLLRDALAIREKAL